MEAQEVEPGRVYLATVNGDQKYVQVIGQTFRDGGFNTVDLAATRDGQSYDTLHVMADQLLYPIRAKAADFIKSRPSSAYDS